MPIYNLFVDLHFFVKKFGEKNKKKYICTVILVQGLTLN